MGMHRIVIKEGIGHKLGESWTWNYDADHTGIMFYNPYHQVFAKGDYIGKEIAFRCAGCMSSFEGEVVKPEDPRRRILWDYGFSGRTRIMNPEFRCADGRKLTWSEVVDKHCGWDPDNPYMSKGCNENGVFLNSADIHIVEVLRDDGTLAVATADGQTVNDTHTIAMSYLRPDATYEECCEWERKYTESQPLVL